MPLFYITTTIKKKPRLQLKDLDLDLNDDKLLIDTATIVCMPTGMIQLTAGF